MVVGNLTSSYMRSHFILCINVISYLKCSLWHSRDVPYTFMLQRYRNQRWNKMPTSDWGRWELYCHWGQLFRSRKEMPSSSIWEGLWMNHSNHFWVSECFQERLKEREGSCLDLFLYSHGWTLLEIIDSFVGITFTYP